MPKVISENLPYIVLLIGFVPALLTAIIEFAKKDHNKSIYVLIITFIVIGYVASIGLKYVEIKDMDRKDSIASLKTDSIIDNLKHQNELLRLKNTTDSLNHLLVTSRFDSSDQKQLRTIAGVATNLKLSAKTLALQLDAIGTLTGGNAYPKIEFVYKGKESFGTEEVSWYEAVLKNEGRYGIPSLNVTFMREENCQPNRQWQMFGSRSFNNLEPKYLSNFQNDSSLNPNNYHSIGQFQLLEIDTAVCVRITMTTKNNIFEQITKFIKRDLGRGFYLFEDATLIRDYNSHIYLRELSPEFPVEADGKVTWEKDGYGKPAYRQ